MPSIISTDKIGTLSYSAPNVTLGPSLVTVGGQQYRTLTNLTANTGTLTALTLYCVYVVISGGAPQLVVSANMNSAGPAGHSRWKIVGSFLTGVAGTFSTFIQADTNKPKLELGVGRTATQSFPNTLSAFITNWTAGSDFFDYAVNCMRIPLAGDYEIKAQINIGPATAHTLSTAPIGNAAVNVVAKYSTVPPSSTLDFTTGLGVNLVAWGSGVGVPGVMTGNLINATAGAHAFATVQSNDTRAGAGVFTGFMSFSLVNIPVKIEDM